MDYSVVFNNLQSEFCGAEFFSGDFCDLLTEKLKAAAGFSKIAFITLKDTHAKYIKQIIPSVSQANAKLVSIIMPDNFDYRIEYFSPLFNLPDDVRAVLVMDRGLYKIASYYAQIKGITLVYVPVSCNAAGILEKEFYIKTGKNIDKVLGAQKVYILSDLKLLKEDAAESYAFSCSRINTLLDYSLTKSLQCAQGEEKYYQIIKEAITSAFNVYSLPEEQRCITLFICGLKIIAANNYLNYIDRSSERVAAILLNGRLNQSAGKELDCALKLTRIFSVCFGTKNVAPVFADYVERAKSVADLLGVKSVAAQQKLLYQTQNLKKYAERIIPAMNALKEKVTYLAEKTDAIKSTYLSLGGTESFGGCENKSALMLCGDTLFGINAVSFIREIGYANLDI